MHTHNNSQFCSKVVQTDARCVPTSNSKSTFDNCTTPVNLMCMKKQTEKLLWHQQLGHPCDKHPCNASKATDGMPTFTSMTLVPDTCPACVCAKQPKLGNNQQQQRHQDRKHQTTKSAMHTPQGVLCTHAKGCPLIFHLQDFHPKMATNVQTLKA